MTHSRHPAAGAVVEGSGFRQGHLLMTSLRRRRPATFSTAADGFVDAALGSLGVGDTQSADFRQGIQRLMHGWGELPVSHGESRSGGEYFAANDGAPFELSVSWRPGGFEARLLCESADGTPGLLARQASGLALTRRVTAGLSSAAVDRVNGVVDLFTSREPHGPFTLMHAVGWNPGAEPGFKLYLNPGVHGPDTAARSVARAMDKLGMSRAWAATAETLRSLGIENHLGVLALDLSDSPRARVKVYAGLPGCSPQDVEDIARLSATYRPGRATGAFDAVYGDASPARSPPWPPSRSPPGSTPPPR
ncbi:tryptophan dimethylallyltransferase family protein [Streptomyces sp. NPDC046465]|uniref:tryptophan dimethylallyltransferase family protein n=1 Tax=Streptomyces sp. NPDC046465 TaxID=3155810 RepID=UPI003409E350